MKSKILAVLIVISIVSVVLLMAGCPSPENKVDAGDTAAAKTSATEEAVDSNANTVAPPATAANPAPATSKPAENSDSPAGAVTPANTIPIPDCCEVPEAT